MSLCVLIGFYFAVVLWFYLISEDPKYYVENNIGLYRLGQIILITIWPLTILLTLMIMLFEEINIIVKKIKRDRELKIFYE